MLSRLTGLLFVAVLPLAAEAATTLDFELKGIFSETGRNNASFGAGPGNVLVGRSSLSLPPTRNYFVFDLADVSETIYSASLVVENPFRSYSSPQDSEMWALYDVTSDIAILQNQFSINPSVYVDLGSGDQYGLREVFEVDQFEDVVVDLNQAALDDINANRGELFAIGGALTTLGGGQESIFGFSNNTHRAQLVLNALPAPPQTVSLLPTVDALATLTSGSFVVNDGEYDINTQRIPAANLDRRGILEFDISDIPRGSTVTSASLELNVNAITQSGSEIPAPLIYGYTGDGLAAPNDAEATSNLLVQTEPVANLGIRTIDLPTDFFESLAGLQDFAGLLIEGSPNGQQVGFWTTEAVSFATPPSLTLTFTPPVEPLPEPGDYNGNGHPEAADYTVWRDSFGSTTDLRADGNNDQTVDESDYDVWKQAYADRPPIDLQNGDFETGDLTGWKKVTTENADVSGGFPRVESFDVDGDGQANSAMRIRVGQIDFDADDPAGGGIAQEVLLLDSGGYLLSADFASTNTDISGNSDPGRYELIFDGMLVDVVDLDGTPINPDQVIRGSLSGTIPDVAPGIHTVELLYLRSATNSREIYGYVDDISLAPLGGGTELAQVPEPATVYLTIAALASVLSVSRPGRR